MVSSNYNGTKVGFVLSPPVTPGSSFPEPSESDMVMVPAAALAGATEYIRALEAKVAELSLIASKKGH